MLKKFKILYILRKASKVIFKGISLFIDKAFMVFDKIKFRFILLLFIIAYSIFMIIMGYILYKSYNLSMEKLNDYVYHNMSYDISRLNYNYPIHYYVEEIPSINKINYIYNRLGIIDYNDYIYNLSIDPQRLQLVLNNNQELQSKVSNVVLADIVYQNSQLFGDIGEQLLKRTVRLTLPLIIAVLIYGGSFLIGNDTSQIINVLS